jgi:hypothetical protein
VADAGTPVTPDSELCRAAAALLHAAAPPVLVGHCERTFQLGAALLGRRWSDCDQEVVYVAASLHDLGLLTDEPLGASATGFQDVGARACADLVRVRTGDGDRAELAGAAVTLHLELGSADDPRPEVAAVHLGAAADVLGARVDQLPDGLLDAVLEAWPRTGFAAWLAAAMQREAQRRPDSTAGLYVRELGLLGLIEAAPLPS